MHTFFQVQYWCNYWESFTVILEQRSPSSAFCFSLSVKRDCRSATWPSNFFLLCSPSCLAWLSERTSMVNSDVSFSRACLAFSRFDFTWAQERKYKINILWNGIKVNKLFNDTWLFTTLYEIMQAYSFGLLQLICKLLHSLGLFLSHLLYLGFMGPVLLLNGSLKQGHFLLTFGPGWMNHTGVCHILQICHHLLCKTTLYLSTSVFYDRP